MRINIEINMKGEYSNFYYVPNAYVNLIINIKAVVFLATGCKSMQSNGYPYDQVLITTR